MSDAFIDPDGFSMNQKKALGGLLATRMIQDGKSPANERTSAWQQKQASIPEDARQGVYQSLYEMGLLVSPDTLVLTETGMQAGALVILESALDSLTKLP